tara:strand:+ start:939 stop:1505 length:567 start_codon:yes stop_codon:yes gene_type:complete
MEKINFKEDELKSVNNDDAKTLGKLCQDLVDAEAEAENIKRLLQEKQAEVLEIKQVKIPEWMSDKNLSQLKLNDGSSITVDNFYGITIPPIKDPNKRAEAYQWLRDNNLGDIIKNEVSARFGRNEDGKAVEFSKLAAANGYEVQQTLSVASATLKATLKELHTKGAALPPQEIFKTFVGKQAKVVRKK